MRTKGTPDRHILFLPTHYAFFTKGMITLKKTRKLGGEVVRRETYLAC